MGHNGSVDPRPIGPHETVRCDRYYAENNHTYFIYGGYEGIPENLLINAIVWLVLLILFSLLRRIAWDYGRIALVSRTETSNLFPSQQTGYNVWTSLFYGDRSSMRDIRASQESLDAQLHRQDKGFCSWIVAFFKLKDEHILQKSGRDAVQYLSFQRYLLGYLAVVTILCIGIVLPVNFLKGDLEGTTQQFGHTTISNISVNSPILWVHCTLAVVFLIIAIAFMRHFSVNLQYEEDEQATTTLMFSNIPRDKCYKNLLLQHLQEAYPETPIIDIQFAYSISKLVRLDRKRQRALDGLVNSEAIYKQTGEFPMMMPYLCGQCCCCCEACNCVKQVDAIEYYTNKEAKYRNKCDQEKVNAFKDTLGIAFVTFENDHAALKVHRDFRVSCKGAHNPVSSSISRQLNVHNWEVKFSPTPDNIYWENLSISPAVWWMKAISVNFLLIILLFFLTTPSVVLNLLNQGNYKKALQDLHNPILVQFVPTLLLWATSSLLPNIVYYSDYYLIGHWTRTAEHHAVMRKTFTFLILMVLILPSLGLTSAKAALEAFAAKTADAFKYRSQCIFLPDNGAFFVNYVITAAFIGTAAELVRIPELLLYAIKLACARSAAERTSVRKSVLWEFQFGIQYAWILCVFTVIMAYSIPCPLITPFGLVYFLLKHLVDRYNIYFAYGPSKTDKYIHASAINCVIVAVIVLQAAILFFTIVRDKMQPIVIFSMVALFISIVIFLGRACFGWFRGLGPILYKQISKDTDSDAGERYQVDQKPFIPSVLLDNDISGKTEETPRGLSHVTHNYGATATGAMMADADGELVDPAGGSP